MSTPAIAPRPRRTWDLVLTIVLLLVYLVVACLALLMAFFLAFASDGCGAIGACNYDLISTGWLIAVAGVLAPVLFVLAGAIILLALRRLAFWVPIVGVVLTIVALVVGYNVVAAGAQGTV